MTEKILVADNETTISGFIKKIVEYDKTNNASVDIANDINSFNTCLKQNAYSLIIIDLSFENRNVNDFIAKFSSENAFTPIIAISADIDINIAMTSMRSGAYDFISKPFSSDTLLLVVKNALEKRQLLKEKEQLNEDISSVNDELTRANEMITKQKEQLDNYVKRLKVELEKIHEISVETGKVRSYETNLKIIFDMVNKVYNPQSSVFMTYDKKSKKFTVKMEHNYSQSFAAGTQADYSVFSKYFGNKGIDTDTALNTGNDNVGIIIPLESGKMILGLIIIIEKNSDFSKDSIVFYEILRYMLTTSILNSRFLEDSRRSYIESLMSFLILEDKVHKGIKKHSEMVAAASVKLAKALKMDESVMRNLQYAGLLHLIGLTVIQRKDLNAENYLESNKSNEIRSAILNASQILEPLVFLSDARDIIKDLFENFNGSGIPSGKSGQSIRKESRILRIVGDYYAFRNIFRMPTEDAKQYLMKNSGSEYDPEILKSFFNIFVKK